MNHDQYIFTITIALAVVYVLLWLFSTKP